MKKLLQFMIYMTILCIIKTNVLAQENFKYKPYPILLLHGFGSGPEQTWGTDTYVANEDRDNRISTQVKENSPYYDEKSEIFKKLHPAFEGIYDYQQEDENVEVLIDRFLPWEENVKTKKESYTGYNHSYLEVFCAFYPYETNDKYRWNNQTGGPVYPEFGIQTGGEDDNYLKHYCADEEIHKGEEDYIYEGCCDYDMCNIGLYEILYEENIGRKDYDISHGGLTQLLRIRVIQLLNEYYGDFKWVNDPSAKIILAGHSNGGVVLTNFLKNEDNDEHVINGKEVTGWYT